MPEIPPEGEVPKKSSENDHDNLAKLTSKEILDKIGFGFGSQQFINILFMQAGASIFLIGFINGLKVVFGNLAFILLERFQSIRESKKLVGIGGIIFGFSFLLIAVSIFLHSVALFALSILIGSITLVIYGESRTFFKISSNKAYLIEKVMKYSLAITAVSLFVAAYLMDNYPMSGTQILLNIFNNLFSFRVYGYLIVFEIAAISFIIAGYILSGMGGKTITPKAKSANFQLKDYSFFIKNKMILVLTITSLTVSLVQTVGYSYYGIFIYQNFNKVMFGGFLNVAMVFFVSVFSSLIGYFITKTNSKVYKKFPILILGILMLSFMPFAYFFKLDLIFITIGTIIGVIGGSAVGVANSLLAIELINFNLRPAYFSFINLVSIPFFLIIAPILAYIAHIYSLNLLFLLLTAILLALVALLLISSVAFKKELI